MAKACVSWVASSVVVIVGSLRAENAAFGGVGELGDQY
ncbi:hypothetical protein D515_04519 [Grimontia indica]|uniref:Uncharacterized protein n=1 Tax=Grimontia indica TaxID=1056512 RepID=R1GM36_9GAMM|nr:hypothetical protein D515_04519 [Grimontia indica]